MTVLLLVAACDGSQPPSVPLPQANGVPYRVFLRTFHDGGYADQPFQLLVKASNEQGAKTILRAEQCKNVSVGQTADNLYVFYDELMLSGFNSFEFSRGEPTVLLCDQHTSECKSARQRLVSAGAKLWNVCSYAASQAS